jgi:methyl-accepting chemotaxis protein
MLSLVGVSFGFRIYRHMISILGEEKSLKAYNDLIWQIGIAVSFNIIAAFIIYQIVTKPLRALSDAMHDLADGKLDIDVPYTKRRTEIGSMARTVAIFKQNAIDKKNLEEQDKISARKAEALEKKRMMESLAKDLENAVLSIVEILTTAASDMQASAQNLSEISDKTSQQSSTVSTATEETSVSIQVVAAAVEELSSSISTINLRVLESTQINSEAVSEVRRADATISTLSDAAVQIGDVVKLIQNIAAQTNLLALNATIEAARAGEAGKGFAVVANEVKNLANQTALATKEITQKIATVQNVSDESVNAIRGIGKTIDRSNEIANNISQSVTQQSAAAKEISTNVQQVSTGANKIATSIVAVTDDAKKSRVVANEVLGDSHKLFQQSERLQREIQTFLSKIRNTP